MVHHSGPKIIYSDTLTQGEYNLWYYILVSASAGFLAYAYWKTNSGPDINDIQSGSTTPNAMSRTVSNTPSTSTITPSTSNITPTTSNITPASLHLQLLMK